MRCVDDVFLEESLEAKGSYLRDHAADVFVMGDDWQGRFDGYREICEVVYLPRTPAISTTALIERIQHPASSRRSGRRPEPAARRYLTGTCPARRRALSRRT